DSAAMALSCSGKKTAPGHSASARHSVVPTVTPAAAASGEHAVTWACSSGEPPIITGRPFREGSSRRAMATGKSATKRHAASMDLEERTCVLEFLGEVTRGV